MQVKILDSRIGSEFSSPTYATRGSAGIDLVACIDEPLVLMPQSTERVGTGVAIHIAATNYAGFLLPRSGLGSMHGIILGNTVGVIDSDYQGEIKACLYNRTSIPYVINPGDKICQLVILRIDTPQLTFVSDFVGVSERGAGGFGSTGK